MSKKKRRNPPQQRRRTRGHLESAPPPPSEEVEDQPLIGDIRRGLRDESPWGLLMTASGILHLTDPRARDLFEQEDDSGVTLDMLMTSFTEIELRETTAALTLFSHLAPDELARARARRALATRRQPLPPWLAGMREVRVPRVYEMADALGDGEDYFLDVRLPGHKTTVVVYVDHNMGTIVKDAFPADLPFDEFLVVVEEKKEPGSSVREVAPADAKARIREAIEAGLSVTTPPTSDVWPQLRPVVEWLLRAMPEDGQGHVREEWSERELEELATAFFRSPQGRGLEPDAHGPLLHSLLWFGTSQGTADPTRWSPVNVEVVLADWFPRKVVDDPAYLAQLPDVLRAFVQFCHVRNGIDQESTSETLESIARWEPEFRGLIDQWSYLPEDLEELLLSDDEVRQRRLQRAVGGAQELEHLDTTALPDEVFTWDGLDDAVRPFVVEVLELLDDLADELLDVENRTAQRRLLRRIALADPTVLSRGAARTAAAGIVWLIARANESTSHYGPLTMADLLAPLGVSSSSQRARTFLAAAGLADQRTHEIALGDPGLLVSARRAELIVERDRPG